MPVDHPLKISIVTPSYKQLPWLKLCVASIADQEGVTVEHIIQDAHSGPELEEWVRQNSSAQLVVERDAGMYDAINRGLRRAQGDICAYLNCDEQYLPGTLRRVADYFEQNPGVDVLFGDSIVADASLQPLAYRRVILPQRWHTLLRPLGILTCSTFFRRKLIEEGALFDTTWKITGDKAWILSLLDRGYRMAVLHEPLAVYALTGVNLSQHEGIRAERVRWKGEVSPLLGLLRPLVGLHHWWRKWRAGAYCKFTRDLHYYQKDNLTRRTAFTHLSLGAFWPKESRLT